MTNDTEIEDGSLTVSVVEDAALTDTDIGIAAAIASAAIGNQVKTLSVKKNPVASVVIDDTSIPKVVTPDTIGQVKATITLNENYDEYTGLDFDVDWSGSTGYDAIDVLEGTGDKSPLIKAI